jgi:hypothetical protein
MTMQVVRHYEVELKFLVSDIGQKLLGEDAIAQHLADRNLSMGAVVDTCTRCCDVGNSSALYLVKENLELVQHSEPALSWLEQGDWGMDAEVIAGPLEWSCKEVDVEIDP